MIIPAEPTKPFTYTPKGSVKRKAVLAAYEQEIEALYKVDEAHVPDGSMVDALLVPGIAESSNT